MELLKQIPEGLTFEYYNQEEYWERVAKGMDDILPAPKEADIRALIHECYNEDSSLTVLDEVGLCYGKAIIDLLLLDGIDFWGFEIKSGADTLNRLPTQATIYNKFFDYMVLVCDSKHLEEAELVIPPWWGLWLVKNQRGYVLEHYRAPTLNPDTDRSSMITLLWKSELLKLLGLHTCFKNLRIRPKLYLSKLFRNSFTDKEIKSLVGQTLRERVEGGLWKSNNKNKHKMK